MPFALVQEPAEDLGSFATNLERLVTTHRDVKMVVYPELHLCSPPGDGPEAADFVDSSAQPLDGPRGRALAALAADLGVWLVPGTVYERGSDGRIYNTAVVYSPEGRRVASYRKIFPWRPRETVASGSEFVAFDMDGFGRVGLSICYDAWFPEVTRHLAWMGAELILNLVQTPTNDRPQEFILNRANAIANQVFVASVNAAAPNGLGQSLIADPEGRVRAQAAGPERVTLIDTIDLDQVDLVRTHGTAGVTRPWAHFDAADLPIDLPLYSGRITPATWSPTVSIGQK